MQHSVRAQQRQFLEKGFGYLINSLEHWLYKENLIGSNRTPYQTILEDGIMSVRHYFPLCQDEIVIDNCPIQVRQERHRIPLLLVPPLAATSAIFDLMPHRSVVRFFLAHGYQVYLIDWGDPNRDHSHLSLAHYITNWMPKALSRIRQVSQQQEISLFSYCMGGLLSLSYAAAFRDQRIRNIITVASPVDMHQIGIAGGLLSLVYRPAHLISKLFNISLMNLNPAHLQVPGLLSSLVFKMTNPLGTLISYWELLLNMWDRDYVAYHTTMNKWFSDMADFPGATIQDFIVKIALGNQIARGKMGLGQREADYTKIKSALLAFAGDADKIVTIPSARKILEVVASADKTFCIVPGGHAGVFAGSKACENAWRISVDWLDLRSD